MTKNKPTFNTNAQQLLVIFSFVSLIVSVMGPISAGTDGTGLGLGPILLSLVAIPFAVGIGAMGIALTIKTDRSIRPKSKKLCQSVKLQDGYSFSTSLSSLCHSFYCSSPLLPNHPNKRARQASC